MRRFAIALLLAAAAPIFMGAGGSVFPSIHESQLSPADRDELDAVSAYLNGITTLKGGFLQIEPSGNVSEGTFYISKPGKMRFEYKPPSATLMVADGHTVAVANTRLNTVDLYPLWETPLGLILNKTIDIRHNPQFVSLEHQQGSLVINMRTNQSHTRANIALVFSEPEYELRQWTVIDNQGSSTTVALRDLVPGATLAPSLFVLPQKNPAPRGRQD
ncbi:MAG TPA: outer membrane lipoprotein carrier protein LolA [Rhizomicrobium sp.]|jgi:outer membrane lipoprotein-sorting protein|nr:outer membrane lipoprotein carrier protein LolA [Rhizomicrobium sp.]